MQRITASLIAASLGLVLQATAAQTDTYGIHAVPIPRKVAIDGNLDDWDLSGQALMCYDVESLQDVYSAKVATMYDADNLYVSLHWKDRTPMGNKHDPRFEAHKGWAGDAVLAQSGSGLNLVLNRPDPQAAGGADPGPSTPKY